MKKISIKIVVCVVILVLGTVVYSKCLTKGEIKVVKTESIIIKDTGKGKVEITNPVVFIDEDTKIIQIELNTTGLDNAKLSYIFIDGKLYTKQQLGNTQTLLDLKNDALKIGKHNVGVAQFNTDKKEYVITTYKTVNYEVK